MTPGGNHNQLMSEINVTPFVDVMLVLLIIFMVTAPMMIEGVKVTLPEAVSGPLSSEKEQLIISIDKDNQIYINDLSVAHDFLQEKMQKILETRSSREVYLKADKNVSYGMVVKIMSELKAAGVEKLGMITQPETKIKKIKKS